MRVAIRVAYDGAAFAGSQRQPAGRTVEGDILQALVAVGAVRDSSACGFEAAGRTDAGVSAAGNVFAFDTEFRRGELVRALNASVRDAWALARAEVPPGWSPRREALRRTYAYHAAVEPDEDVGRAAAAFARFVGTHDFRSFARVEPNRDPRRTVDVARVSARGAVWTFTVEGRSFLWNQVRRMVAAALAAGRGEATAEDVGAALDLTRPRDFGVAPAEGLTLQDVLYGPEVRWETEAADAGALLREFRTRVSALRLADRRERLRLNAVEALR